MCVIFAMHLSNKAIKTYSTTQNKCVCCSVSHLYAKMFIFIFNFQNKNKCCDTSMGERNKAIEMNDETMR